MPNIARLKTLADFLEGTGEFEGLGPPIEKFDMNHWFVDTNVYKSAEEINNSEWYQGMPRYRDEALKRAASKATRIPNTPAFVTDDLGALPVKCQAAGCALGWAATIPEFRQDGLRLKLNEGMGADVMYMGDRNEIGAAHFFSIPYDVSESFFSPSCYVGVFVTSDITPTMVAQKIRAYIQEVS
jgi:hypothetical protein